MKLKQFHRRFEDTNKDDRFQMINVPTEPSSIFVIYKLLQQVRAQRKYYKDREEQLLALAELGFKQLDKKDGYKSKKT